MLAWLGKNLYFYANPLEPFFERLFRPADAQAIAREKFYIASHYPQGFLSAAYWSSLLPRLHHLEWYVLAPLAGVGLVLKRRPNGRLLLFCLVAYLLWNLVRESQNRFLLPVMLLLIMLGVQTLQALPAGLVRAVSVWLLALLSVSALVSHAMRIGGGGEFAYLGQLALVQPETPEGNLNGARSEFYKKNLGALGEVTAQVNAYLPPESRLLLVYEARPYLFARRTLYNTVFDESVLLELARGASSAEEVRARLRQAGITHVLVNREELRRFIEQYARAEQLARAGIEDVRSQFHLLATPEDLYPPFFRSASWQALHQPILDFLAQTRSRALFVAGKAPLEVWLAPL
jgi:hypothetical protein